MIAISAFLVEDTPAMGSLPALKCLDTTVVLALWIAIALAYTCFVKYVVHGSLDELRHCCSPSWWKHDSVSIVHSCCPKRKARFFKCVKRSARRKLQCGSSQQGQDGKNWSCPFDCSFARIHMPAPLPFRRKKRPSTIKVTECKDIKEPEEVPDLSVFSDESASLVELPSSDELEGVSPPRKSKRRNRRKRRPSFSPLSSAAERDDSLTPSPIGSLPVTSTTLIDLALMQNWQQLLVNVKANKKQARQRDADGLYALHWAVSAAPPLEVVRALVKAYPGATKKVDSEGSNALHFASHYGGSEEMVAFLLKTYPRAITVQDNYGRSALYHAVDKSANIDVLRILATADPTMITTSCRPKNYRMLEKEGKTWNYLTPLYLAWVNALMDQRSVETCGGKVWDKGCLLLDLTYRHRYNVPEDADVPVVTAMIALDDLLPEELAAVAILGLPSEELLKVEPVSGKNALALAASLSHLSSKRSDEMIRLLLEACPKAATALDREGKTALANAAASGKTWESGLERLVRATPDALGWSDKSGLTPSLLLASSTPQTTDNSGSGVVLADPYSLLGVKTLSLRRRALEQRRKQKATVTPSSLGEVDHNTKQLSAIFQLVQKDPTWVVTA